ncbi:MAG: DUF975 family protein [Bacteroidales bacterium]|nr:DUF975 family protein [Bacteroidales bacterium]
MIENKEIRASALRELKGFWTMPVLATLVYTIISSACSFSITTLNPSPFQNSSAILGSFPPTLVIILSLISLALSIFVQIPLSYGFELSFLHFVREDKEDTVERIFDGFKTYGRALAVELLGLLLVMVFTLLLIIPGIIKALAYSMAVFVSKDHPEMSAYECLMHSEAMMYGHKMQLFLLCLSFIGWIILSIFTLGIGLLWLIPYVLVSLVKFYEQLKDEIEPSDVPETEAVTIPGVTE